ncbi:TPA: DUF4391 domain-containing protein [Escherichia coli]|nr:DUF4391 domain-containing protein [Escherichia coli]
MKTTVNVLGLMVILSSAQAAVINKESTGLKHLNSRLTTELRNRADQVSLDIVTGADRMQERVRERLILQAEIDNLRALSGGARTLNEKNKYNAQINQLIKQQQNIQVR